MVIVKDVKSIQKKDGKEFHCLILEGEAEPVRNKSNGRIYFTARRATVPTTLDLDSTKAMMGKELDGTIQKVSCDPYEHVDEDSGEIVMFSHRWEYVNNPLG